MVKSVTGKKMSARKIEPEFWTETELFRKIKKICGLGCNVDETAVFPEAPADFAGVAVCRACIAGIGACNPVR